VNFMSTYVYHIQLTHLTGPEGFASSVAELQYKRDASKICYNLDAHSPPHLECGTSSWVTVS